MSLFASSQLPPPLIQVSSEFQQIHPFDTTTGKSTTKEGILNKIDEQIMIVLSHVLTNNLAIDVAFIHINVLIHYATVTMHELFLGLSDDSFINYYTFLFYFVINSCTRVQSVILPSPKLYKRCERFKLFEYLMATFVPTLNKHAIEYKHCNTRRHTIITSLMQQTCVHINIATLIADFTQLQCEEFFSAMATFCAHWQYDSGLASKQLHHYCNLNAFDNCVFALIIPKLLLCSQSYIKDTNLIFFANQMLLKCLLPFDPEYHLQMISNLFASHFSIKPWKDAQSFLYLLESIETILQKDDAYVLNAIAQCMEDKSLLVFSNAKSCIDVRIDRDSAAKEIQHLVQNIDHISKGFISQYCVLNQRILGQAFSQMFHLVTYIDMNGLYESKNGCIVMDKLRRMFVFVLEHFEDATFDHVHMSREVFAQLIELKADTNIEQN